MIFVVYFILFRSVLGAESISELVESELCQGIINENRSEPELRSCAYTAAEEVGSAVNDTIFFKWTEMQSSDKDAIIRCQCGIPILIEISNGNLTQLCDPQQETHRCESFCYDSNQKCSNSTCSASRENKDICVMYSITLGTSLTLVTYGLSCLTISTHSANLCDQLTISDDTNRTEPIALSIGLILGITAGISVATYIMWKKHRKQRNNFQERNFNERSISEGYPIPEHSRMEYDHLESFDASFQEQFQNFKENFGQIIINISDIQLKEEVGEGAFGKVYKGLLKRTSEDQLIYTEVAIKSLKSHPTPDLVKELISESVIMLDFNHPNVLKLLGVCFDTEPLIIIPYMANGDMKNFLISCRGENDPDVLPEKLTFHNLLSMCFDVAKGMEYLSRLKFVHRDLAARNCMVSKELEVKVADFGFSRDIYSREYYRLEHRTRLPVKWLPPESLYDNIYNEKTDVWSFGVVCWEVYSLGRIPYPGLDNADIPDYISSGNRLKKPSLCPNDIYDIMTSCWIYKAAERLLFCEIVIKLRDLIQSGSNNGQENRPYFVLESTL